MLVDKSRPTSSGSPSMPSFHVWVFGLTVVAVLLAFEVGLRLGRWKSRQPDPEPEPSVRALVASILGVLAFVLGFAFGLASAHYDTRNQAVFDEAVAIRTAYRRSDLLPESARVAMRQLLRDYVDARVAIGASGDAERALMRLRELQDQMWTTAVGAQRHPNGVPTRLAPMMQSVTEVIDVHGQRVFAGFRARIPSGVWVALYGVMGVAVAAAGYDFGLAGTRRSLAVVAYAVVFSTVIFMIAAADIPGPEQIRSNHQVLTDLQSSLQAP
jgi:hypothetical protein